MRKMELIEAVKRNCLPDYLTIKQWVWLIYPDPDNQHDYDDPFKRQSLELDRRILTEKILDACMAGVLRFEGDIKGWEWEWELYSNPHPLTDNNIFVRCKPIRLSAEVLQKRHEIRHPDDCVIHKADMKPYLKSNGKWTIKDLPEGWYPDVDEKNKRRDNQISFICKTADEIGYKDLLDIPIDGKASIKTECLKNKLFTKSGFDHAWKEASSRGLISIQEKNKYLPRQKGTARQ